MKPSHLLLLVVLSSSLLLHAQRRRSAPEQVRFSAEDSTVTKPATLPRNVLQLLRKDEDVRSMLSPEQLADDNFPEFFRASVVHLSRKKKPDYVVIGQPPLSGANVTTFWVIESTPKGPRAVVKAPAHDLWIKRRYWRGHRIIELSALTAVEVSSVLLRFNGREYESPKDSSEKIR